ncbi:uncharacterized protein LY79DRAFT_568788 [Colletotrichum navitas]|uniref:Uncharacterized protein n=1 Tax=Colletotrichum navitas TaxID=681940 RepID=A0AAD8PN83_9PEZI|nr:uncharacterized protein LY79DRAFT_568788 [Colletotrichum navitas]KAK1573295.1 hypothetical protein LY79DRAFT_568788 [Colletotrichum navitas]
MEDGCEAGPRFCKFLIIDEGSLRSLAALPEKPLHVVLETREERLVGCLTGSQATLRGRERLAHRLTRCETL